MLPLHRELIQKSSTNAAKGCLSTDTDTNGKQLEPYNTNAVYGMVDKSKKKIQSRKSEDLIPSTYGMDGM